MDGGGEGRAQRARIGTVLVEHGALDAPRLRQALSAQRDSVVRLGEIVARRGWSSFDAVARAAAEQAGVEAADLTQAPLDPALLDPDWIPTLLRHGIAPWRRRGDTTVFVAGDLEEGRRGLAALGLAPPRAALALAPRRAIATAMVDAHGPALARRAAERAPEAQSARLGGRRRAAAVAVALGAAAAACVAAPGAALGAVFVALCGVGAVSVAVRSAALIAALRADRAEPDALAKAAAADAAVLAARRPLPRITLLIPLLHEPNTPPVLIDALNRLRWPRELLDVKLILEPDDGETLEALRALGPPPFCEVMIAPKGAPRTKPRALNYALDFAEGDIIGVYDAEDRPAPDQLAQVAARFANSPPEVACLQARLAYYNARDGWLTRCFAIEYAIWFGMLLPGVRRLGLPIPLGGTSVFFRRAALVRAGGWDAHNVTEDADLGMRLARMGLRSELIDSETEEEASSRYWQWIRQRSRWLKGYMITWSVHMRRPGRLWRELGPWGFLGFQATFLGAAAAYLGLPLLWTVWGAGALGGDAWGAAPSWPAAATMIVLMLAGWATMAVAAVVATGRRGDRDLWPWILTLALYWPLGAVAAWVALGEAALSPSTWRKTPHGLGPGAAAARADAMRRLGQAPRADTTPQASAVRIARRV